MTAAAPGQQRRQLHDEYAALREKLLRHLLRQAATLCETGALWSGESCAVLCCAVLREEHLQETGLPTRHLSPSTPSVPFSLTNKVELK